MLTEQYHAKKIELKTGRYEIRRYSQARKKNDASTKNKTKQKHCLHDKIITHWSQAKQRPLASAEKSIR